MSYPYHYHQQTYPSPGRPPVGSNNRQQAPMSPSLLFPIGQHGVMYSPAPTNNTLSALAPPQGTLGGSLPISSYDFDWRTKPGARTSNAQELFARTGRWELWNKIDDEMTRINTWKTVAWYTFSNHANTYDYVNELSRAEPVLEAEVKATNTELDNRLTAALELQAKVTAEVQRLTREKDHACTTLRTETVDRVQMERTSLVDLIEKKPPGTFTEESLYLMKIATGLDLETCKIPDMARKLGLSDEKVVDELEDPECDSVLAFLRDYNLNKNPNFKNVISTYRDVGFVDGAFQNRFVVGKDLPLKRKQALIKMYCLLVPYEIYKNYTFVGTFIKEDVEVFVPKAASVAQRPAQQRDCTNAPGPDGVSSGSFFSAAPRPLQQSNPFGPTGSETSPFQRDAPSSMSPFKDTRSNPPKTNL